MRSTSNLPHPPEFDELAAERVRREAKLRDLQEQTQRVLSESRQLLATHEAACARMSDAVREARLRLALAQFRAPPSWFDAAADTEAPPT